MANTFSPDLSDQISKVRIEIGDVGNGLGAFPKAAEVADETIEYFLSLPLSPIRAAARVAWTLVAKYASMVDVTVDHQLTRASQRYAQYLGLAKRLDALAASGTLDATPTSSPNDGPIVLGIGDMTGPVDSYGCPINGPGWYGSPFLPGCGF